MYEVNYIKHLENEEDSLIIHIWQQIQTPYTYEFQFTTILLFSSANNSNKEHILNF